MTLAARIIKLSRVAFAIRQAGPGGACTSATPVELRVCFFIKLRGQYSYPKAKTSRLPHKDEHGSLRCLHELAANDRMPRSLCCTAMLTAACVWSRTAFELSVHAFYPAQNMLRIALSGVPLLDGVH
jgi:hypothetical protein